MRNRQERTNEPFTLCARSSTHVTLSSRLSVSRQSNRLKSPFDENRSQRWEMDSKIMRKLNSISVDKQQ